MDAALQNAISLGAARLRKAFPQVGRCEAAIDGIRNGAPCYSVRLDLRLAQSQILVCGAPADSIDGALDAAFKEAGERLLRSAARAA